MFNNSNLPDHEIEWESIYSFVKENYLLNRTIVSKDISHLINNLEKHFDISIYRHKYNTGEDHGTWIVPQSWNVIKAFIKDSNNNIIASYAEHPLFVAPYSASIDIRMTKNNLKEYVLVSDDQPNAFSYDYRIAFDPYLANKKWGITIPKERWEKINNNEICHVYIETEVFDDEMIIGEVTYKGDSKDTIVFLSDYCHPGQINDSFSGLVMFMDFMNYLKNSKIKTHYTYTLLILPETIGSAIYLASNSQEDKNLIGAIFSDNVSYGAKWYIKNTRSSNSYMDMIAKECTYKFTNLTLGSFYSLVGNDEHIFDSPQVNIPSLSIQKYNYKEYHTSNDNLDLLKKDNLQTAFEILKEMVRILELDQIYEFAHNVPFHMSRYHLFADFDHEKERYFFNKQKH